MSSSNSVSSIYNTDINLESGTIYGYARVSTPRQNIERQVRNIKKVYPSAIMIMETYTGTSLNRKKLLELIKLVKTGDIIVFDSVSRFGRNAEECFEMYMELFECGVHLIFLKEPHVNTSVYRNALNSQIAMTGEMVDVILEAVNKYLLLVAKQQIMLAFEQAEKEVTDLRQRTKEGIVTARLNGKQIGRVPGMKYSTKKSVAAKEIILKKNKAFGGPLTDEETMKLAGIGHNAFYRYKKTLREEI